MSDTFFDRFAAAAPVPDAPVGLQVLFADPPDLDPDAVATVVRGYHPDLAAATVELVRVAGTPMAAKVVSADGPPASAVGLIGWGPHRLKLAAFDAPMPYGPVQSCVAPAMLPPELKDEAARHAAHLLLFYAGDHPDPLERYVALAAAAGAVARFGGVAVLNEEARAAAPWYDLLPGDGEDGLATLRGLPVPYLWGGFVKLDVGDPDRPWARTFASHRLGLPNLARRLAGHHQTAETFRLFDGLLNYLKQSGERFEPGDTLDLGDGTRLRLREPADAEWFLDGDGRMLVVQAAD